MTQIRFGPAGNSLSFYERGYKRTEQAPAWLEAMGLNAFEYSFGRGVSLGEATAKKIREAMQAHGVCISVHAPYFINLAVADEERREKNFRYFQETAHAAQMLGAKRVVFHPGAVTKMTRQQAKELAEPFLKEILAAMDAQGFSGLTFCPETMGKLNQYGDLSEVISLCQLDERLIPTVDFGHLHARGIGAIQGREDFARILDVLENGVGRERASVMHVHFSRIEYTKAGEKRHRTFAETEYGPDFAPLAELVAERGWTPHFICESNGTMAEDALTMKQLYEQAAKNWTENRDFSANTH